MAAIQRAPVRCASIKDRTGASFVRARAVGAGLPADKAEAIFMQKMKK